MVRAAVLGDVPAILRLIRELAEYERSSDEVRCSEEQLREGLFEAEPHVFAHVVEVGGQVVGCAVWFLSYSTWLGTHGIYLEDLYVSPSARGGGYGKALVAELARIAVERGYGRVEWSVLDWNELAIGFYKGLGAQAQDEWIGYRLSGEALVELSRKGG